MKKVLFFILVSISGYSQLTNIDTTGKGNYCRVFINSANDKTVMSNNTKLYLSVDFGNIEFDSKKNRLLDKNGKEMLFFTMISIFNYFYENGWEIKEMENAGAFSNHTLIFEKRKK